MKGTTAALRATRAGRIALVAAAAAVTMTSGAARATTVASDFVLPIWQGTSTSAAATGHLVDCSNNTSTNPSWSSGCTITIFAITSGSNCAVESITNPASGIGGANTYQGTQCLVEIKGTASMTEVAGQSCHFTPELLLTHWSSGVNSTLFHLNSAYPLTAAMVPLTTAGGQLVPNQYALTVKSFATGFVVDGHVITMNERFLVKFNRPTLHCPNPDGFTNVKGNVYDAAVDGNLNGQDGYFTDTVAVL